MVNCFDLLTNRKFQLFGRHAKHHNPEFFYVGEDEEKDESVFCVCKIRFEKGVRVKVICQICFRQDSRGAHHAVDGEVEAATEVPGREPDCFRTVT